MVRKIVIDNLSEYTYQRLLKQKALDGFKEKSWHDWVLSKGSPTVQVTDAEGIRASTRSNLRQLWGRNMGHNLSYTRRKDMKSLRDIIPPPAQKCLIVGGGPSIELHNQLETLASADRSNLTVISCDKMLIPLLSHRIVPDYVVTVDGSEIIAKFFKHPLVKINLNKMKILVHIAVNPVVIRWLYRNKADVYWFLAHQIYVSEEEIEQSDAIVTISMTSTKQHIKGVQTIVAAGNVGVAAWALAVIVLKQPQIGLIGFDMGYPLGTPLNKTYYYSTFLNMVQAKFGTTPFSALSAQIPYEKEYNPVWKSYTYTDQVFRQYKQMFCDLLDIVPSSSQTWSLVEGGALHHPKLKYATLKDWLENDHYAFKDSK